MALCVPPLPKNLKANIIAGVPLEYGSIVVEALLAADFPVDRCGLCCLLPRILALLTKECVIRSEIK